jgi:NAD(P)-dependent dehydrogenase (short-subunit alcohol dehydrogenase family)
MFRTSAEEPGKFDILVNNAALGVIAPLLETTEET